MKSLRSATLLAVLATFAASAAFVTAAPAAFAASVPSTGTHYVLVMLAGWDNGSTTPALAPETANSIAGDAAEWVSTVSSGAMHLAIEVYPDYLSIRGPEQGNGCQADKDALMQQAKDGVGVWQSPSNNNLSTYDDFILYFPQCTESIDPDSWATQGGQGVWLNGVFTVHDIVAGLGHNMGLTASNARVCPTGDPNETCSVTPAGDPFDPMGAGSTAGFNAAEKNQLGWLAGTQKRDVGGGGTVTLHPPDGTTSTIQAAFMTFGPRTYWLEYRQQFVPDDALPDEAVDGVLVHEVDTLGAAVTNTRFDDGSGDIWTIPQNGSWVNHEGVRISVGTLTATGAPIMVSRPQLTVSTAGTGAGTVTSTPAGIDCGATCTAEFQRNSQVTLTAAPTNGSAFAGWSGGCTGTGTCSVLMASNQTVTATFTPGASTTRFEESAIGFDGWSVVTGPGANGGSYRLSSTRNNTATFTSARTTSLTLLTRKGPQFGNATVTIDGVSKGTVNLAASTEQAFSQTFAGLPSRTHKVVIKVAGTHAAPSSGNGVAVDGFVVGATTTQESAKAVSFEAWKTTTAAGASGGSYRATATRNASATLTFTGTGVDWVTTTGPNRGNAQVFIDGVSKGTFDQYATSAHLQVVRAFTGLSSGQHTIRVQVLGTKRAASTGTSVPVDAFVVHG